MITHRMPGTAVVAAGVGLSLAGDYLLRAPGGPGLNFALLFAGLATAVVITVRTGGRRPDSEGSTGVSAEASGWLVVGVVFGAGLLWRGSELLRVLAFLAAAAAFALPALHGGRAWVRRTGVTELCEALAAAGIHAALGSLRLFHRAPSEALQPGGPAGTGRAVARSVVVGVLVALVPLTVFGALLVSADPVFAGIVADSVRIDLEVLASHVALAAILSWMTYGYLSGFDPGTRLEGLRRIGWSRPSLGAVEVVIALGLVDLLFLGFVAVQFRYLFGGQAWVEVTSGLTYAAYAREGFFQLVVATALGLPWLLVAEGLLGARDRSTRPASSIHRTFRWLAGAQLVLLLAIAVSAGQRLRAYLDTYGLTESRFVAAAVLGWAALLLVWFGATVLRGRRNRFAFGALVSVFGLVASLHLADPSGYAAQSHLDRAAAITSSASEPTSRVDIPYLASLGSDAVPILVERLVELEGSGRCTVARALLRRWSPERPTDWRSWNHADWRARRMVAAEESRLRTMAGAGEACE